MCARAQAHALLGFLHSSFIYVDAQSAIELHQVIDG